MIRHIQKLNSESWKRLPWKKFRKDLFRQEATRLGVLLAERMEDSEGWHGIEREERLENWRKGNDPK